MREIYVWKCGTCHKLLLLGGSKDRHTHLTCRHAYILPAQNKQQYPFTKMRMIKFEA